ncbi:uncharacterized protein involved in exopolysaccharide biosynthesis [Sphingomonas vulcanisoli]|uniref:Uncharacterized protein involved in exopolysaccharide biosynthesis n=1 Tax=Sphingomonas vulcanisoli TaxID=1658060 RepID=A0ABX0TRA7_9SPHN|nr:GNVR domain-containing protein [Sphingomonas vulcanisoli]NIJ08064.1 uncharacterized protein involved in exopolysaccharide biosynthesis [Sphingomonas vulcanisoli]
MTFAQLIRLLLSRWKTLMIGGFIGAVLMITWSLLTAPMYRATAQVIVDVRPPETLSQQTPIDQLSPDYLATQMDILLSVRIARIVVQRLQLASNSALLQNMGWDGQGSVEDFIVSRLQKNLKVQAASLASRVIEVNYASNSASFSAGVANAFAQAYVDTVLDLQSQPARDSAAWYQRRAREVQRELAAAQSRLTIRQRELGVATDLNQPNSSDDTRLQALSAQLAAVQAQDAMTNGKGNDLPGVLANPVVQQLQSDIAKLEGQRRQLAQTAGPNNPDYRQVVGQLAALRGQLATQQAQVQQGSRVAAGQTTSSVSRLTEAVAAEKARVIDSKARRDEVAVLAQDVRNLQTMYDQMAARRSQLDLLGDSTQSNVTILTPAVPPELPYWPRKSLMAIAGIFLGGMVAAGITIFRELADQRLRGHLDYETWLGIPDLGTLRIGPPAPRRLTGRVASRVVGLLPFRGKGAASG